MKLNPYLKFAVSLVGPLVTSLGTVYGPLPWWPAVATGVASALVYLVPNLPGSTVTATVTVPKA